MRIIAQFLVVLVFPLFSSSLQSNQFELENTVYIKAGNFFDSKNKKFKSDVLIKISGNKVIQVRESSNIPQDAKVYDLTDFSVIPGLIDSHTHVFYEDSFANSHSEAKSILFQSDGLRAYRGAKRAKSWLMNGFTTIRDLGDSGKFLDVDLRDAIKEGTVVGPRMYVSGPIISSEGGQIPGLVWKHMRIADEDHSIVRNVDDATNVVRKHVNQRVDLIKICAENSPNNTSLTVKEMKEIVKMAHRYSKKVTAHAISDLSIKEAIEAGVDIIEHGYSISEKTLKLLGEKNIPIVPTHFTKGQLKQYIQEINYQGNPEAIYAFWDNSLKKIVQASKKHGVKIITGSDAYWDYGREHGKSAKEVLRAYYDAGLSPVEILSSSTYLSAKAYGVENEIGSIEKGSFADIIALKGDIESDFIGTLNEVVFVMKDGKVYLNKTTF